MPITPHFSWSQNDNAIEMIIEMYGINKHLLKHYVQITPIYFCLNISPYLLQIDFENEIDPFHIKVIIMTRKQTKFIFPKRIQNQKWNNLLTNKEKSIRLENRLESIDKLHKKQQEIRQKRKKQKKLRFKAAQQRQWDEDKYFKHIINKLENQTKQESTNDLKNWSKQEICSKEMNETNSILDDDNKEINVPHPDIEPSNDITIEPSKQVNEENSDIIEENKETEIRESNVIEVGFSEWDYITPVRQQRKPPEFARKTLIKNAENKSKQNASELQQISEITPIFLCDKGMKYFMNKDYESAINVFNEAIKLDVNYLEAYCNKYQCYIQLVIERKNDKNINNDLLIDIDKAESILELLQRKQTEDMINESMSNNKENIISVTNAANMIILLQKGIINSFLILNKLKDKSIIDDELLVCTKMAFEKGLKSYEINEKMNNLDTNFGLFKQKHIIQNLKKMSMKFLNINNIIILKQNGNNLLQNKKYIDAIEKYSKALEMISDNINEDNDCVFLKYQCLNNRSSAYFSSKQFMKCIQDCSLIIENRKDCKAFVKRGGSYLSLWKINDDICYLEKCLKDYKDAFQYDTRYETHVKKIEKLLMLKNNV